MHFLLGGQYICFSFSLILPLQKKLNIIGWVKMTGPGFSRKWGLEQYLLITTPQRLSSVFWNKLPECLSIDFSKCSTYDVLDSLFTSTGIGLGTVLPHVCPPLALSIWGVCLFSSVHDLNNQDFQSKVLSSARWIIGGLRALLLFTFYHAYVNKLIL